MHFYRHDHQTSNTDFILNILESLKNVVESQCALIKPDIDDVNPNETCNRLHNRILKDVWRDRRSHADAGNAHYGSICRCYIKK